MAIYDICFSLAAGRNAAQAPIFVEMMRHQTANCRKEPKNEDSFLKVKKKMAGLVLQFFVNI